MAFLVEIICHIKFQLAIDSLWKRKHLIVVSSSGLEITGLFSAGSRTNELDFKTQEAADW